jgi:spore coat protein U-like protein
MKKLIAFVLAALMLTLSALPVFAEESSSWGGTCAVNYFVESQYSIWIPEEINLNETYTFEAEFLNITPEEQVNVDCINLSNGTITLSNGNGKSIAVEVYNGRGDTRLAEFTDSMTSNISFWGNLQEGGRAGYYTGVLEFSISLGAREG